MSIIAGGERAELITAYHDLLRRMSEGGSAVECRAWGTRCLELTAAGFIARGGSHRERISRFGIHTPDSLKAYCEEMLDGTLDWAVREGKEPYTYHDRLSNQWREALDILREDPGSRRAVMTLRLPEDITMDDQPCLTTIQLLIRGGRLDMLVFFRSNDLWEATYMNAYALMELQLRWAGELGVGVGDYLHFVGSLHVYKKNWDALHTAASQIREDRRNKGLPRGDLDLSIPAEDFWEALT